MAARIGVRVAGWSLAGWTAAVCFAAVAGGCDQSAPANAQTKPAITQPAETKPAQTKPEATKPQPAATTPSTTTPGTATPVATTPQGEAPNVDPKIDPKLLPTPAWEPTPQPALPTTDVKLGSGTYALEQAMTNEQRFHGLSGRTEVPEHGGMIFVFREARRMEFVMRDCPIDIDIIFVNAAGRITSMHHMKAEAPRSTEEQKLSPTNKGDPEWTWSNAAYESRLKKYSSRFDACIAIELRGGTLKLGASETGPLELKVNDKLDLDIKALQTKAE